MISPYIIIACIIGLTSYQISQNQVARKQASVCYLLLLPKEEVLILKTPSVIFLFDLDSEMYNSVATVAPLSMSAAA